MIFNFKRHSKKQNSSNLAEMLSRCISQECRLQRLAQTNLSIVYNSAMTAVESIRQAKYKCSKQKFNDTQILASLDSQLNAIDKDLMSTFYEVKSKIESKSKEKVVFNITLFGRTMVGKSTMMSILTNGNSEAIGQGGQRTTRDVRRYQWHGMTVTDVPGVDAFRGEDDEQLALSAATNADLIIFMITDDAPSPTEAEWLARLVKLDKPMLCLINCKFDLVDDFDREEFIENPKANGLSLETIKEITAQFNEFINKYLPGKQMPFIALHLQAEWMSRQKRYAKVARQLHNASQFAVFENALIEELATHGLMFRIRSYITTIDSAVYSFSRALLRHSEDSFNGYISVKEKFEEFKKWQSEFNKLKLRSLHGYADDLFDRIDNGIPAFLDINIENSDFKNQWERYIDSYSVDCNVKGTLEKTVHEVQSYIQNLFSELNFDISQTIKINNKCFVDKSDIFNSRRFWGWSSGIVGAVGVIAGFIASGPIGWILGGVAALFGVFSRCCSSKEKKLRNEKIKALAKLKEGTAKMRKQVHAAITKAWHKNIMPVQTEAYNRLKTLENVMLSLTNVERTLGIAYNRQHRELSTQLIWEVMKSRVNERYGNSDCLRIGRIPGRITALLNNTQLDLYNELCEAQIDLCLNERLYHWSGSYEVTKENILKFFRLLNLRIRFRLKDIPIEKGNNQSIVYVDKTRLSDEEMDKLELIEQLLDIHFMQGYRYEY